jgi:putative transposase
MKNDIIFREDTNVAGMMRNHKIARAMQDAAIGELNRQIDYKCEFYGKKCIKTGRWFPSSKTCNHCGHVNANLKLSDRVWVCPHCHKVVIRDYNAARNILEEGINLYRAELGQRYIVTHICVLKRTQTDDKCEQSSQTGKVGPSSPDPAGILIQ